MASELSNFDEEIMVEILSRLPPKSLMRFKCVRRSWNGLINSHNFTATHLSASKRTALSSSSTTLIFRRFLSSDLNDPNETEIVLSLFNFCSDDFEAWFVEDIHFPHFLGLEYVCKGKIFIEGVGSNFQIVCHCDGIICLADYGQKPTVVLCNLATKEFKLLPESPFALSTPAEPFPTAAAGFGHDLRSNSYKVVRFIHNGSPKYEDIHPLNAEVYNLKTNTWKEIKIDGLEKENTIILPESAAKTRGLYFKGIIYWLALEHEKVDPYDSKNEQIEIYSRIISFNLADETFHVIDICSNEDHCNLGGGVLGLWKESITLCVSGWTGIDIWVMNDFSGGGKGSWTKYLALEPVVKICTQFALFGKSDEHFVLVACDHENSVVIFYHVFTNNFIYLPLNGALLHIHFTRVVEYVTSIVSVEEGNKLEMGT